MRRDTIINYLQRITSPSSIKKHQHRTSTLGSFEGSFTLPTFNEFVNTYTATNYLAPEAEEAFNVLIDSLDQYFNFIENITDEDVKATLIKWYTNAIVSGNDIIRARSNYYGTPAFSNVAINMNEEETENYNTFDGICFAKVNQIN